MSSLDRRRDNVARTQNARTNSSLSSRKDQIEKEIQTLLRGKTANMIDSSLQLSLLRRVAVLLPALIVEKTIDAELREMNKRLRNIEQNISKTTTAIEFYAAAAKIESRIEENATTTRLAKFNNLNQQRQLNELKKNKTLIYKIRKKNEKTKIRALFSKKLMKRIIRAEEQKNDVLTIRRLSSENIEILTRSVKTKQRLKQNKTLFKDIAMTTSLSRRTFEVMIHGVRIASINTRNQQKTIAHIIRQNASMHSNLKIARVI
jgi:FKBP-type peptidyl-prolyl cis-trans isomerase (trigger factor)